MQDQALDGKVVDFHNSLQIPSLNDDNDSASQGYRDRMPLQKESGPRPNHARTRSTQSTTPNDPFAVQPIG